MPKFEEAEVEELLEFEGLRLRGARMGDDGARIGDDEDVGSRVQRIESTPGGAKMTGLGILRKELKWLTVNLQRTTKA